MRIVIGLALAVLGAACGSDEIDLSGVYRVDSAVGSAPCGADEPISYAPFVKFQKDDFFGATLFTYEGCTDESGTSCQSMGGLFGGFAEPIDDGWRGVLSSSSGGGPLDCALGFTQQTAILKGSALTIEVSSHFDTVMGLSEEQCSPEEAESRGTELPCEEHELVLATKL